MKNKTQKIVAAVVLAGAIMATGIAVALPRNYDAYTSAKTTILVYWPIEVRIWYKEITHDPAWAATKKRLDEDNERIHRYGYPVVENGHTIGYIPIEPEVKR